MHIVCTLHGRDFGSFPPTRSSSPATSPGRPSTPASHRQPFATSTCTASTHGTFDDAHIFTGHQQAMAAGGGGYRHQQECRYFFCTKGSKYSSGLRARRATRSGYWKSTGNDKTVYSSAGGGSSLVGTKKTLVFYGGRAPRGKRTGWVMHEYALGESALLRGAQSEWVICRVLRKKDPSSDCSWKPETEDTAVHGGYDGGEQDVEPPPAYSHGAGSQSGSRAVTDDCHDEKDLQFCQMAQDYEELLVMNYRSGSSSTSPPPPWLSLHDAQLGTTCSALQPMQMQSDDGADYYSLPELLDYDADDYNHDLLNQGAGGEMDRRAETSAASVDDIRLGGPYGDFGF